MTVLRLRRLALPVAVALLALGTGACSSSVSDAATLTYTDTSGTHTVHVSRADFTNELGQLVGSKQFQAFLKEGNFDLTGDLENTTGKNLAADWLTQRVRQSAIDAEFQSLDLSMPADRSSAEQAARQFFGMQSELGQDAQGNLTMNGTGVVFSSLPKSLQTTLIDRQARLQAVEQYYKIVTPAKVRAVYDEFEREIVHQLCPSGRMVSHILVKDAATAQSILDQLKAGASFAKLATSDSTDTGSAKSGGSVGCLSSGQFVKEFEAAAASAPFDTPVGPVHTQFGYHVIEVHHPAYADFQSVIEQTLQQSPGIIPTLRLETAKIWISPQFGTWAQSTDSSGNVTSAVRPPVAPAPREAREKGSAATTTTTLLPPG